MCHLNQFFKSTVIIMLLCLTYTMSAQNITISMDNITVRNAIEYLQREYKYSFSIGIDDVAMEEKVSIHADKASVKDVLNQIFVGQKVEISIKGKSIIVNARKDTNLIKQKVITQSNRIVKGVILDEDSEVLAGAVILENGTENTAISDIDGEFEIVLKDPNSVLTVSFFGYRDAEVIPNPKLEKVTVRMQTKPFSLDDAVVVGYGSMTRRDITSAIGSFKPKASEKRDVLSVDQLLQGRVAGVNISTSSGVLGSSSRVSIRGTGSLSASNEPLYVVDGVPIISTAGDAGAFGEGESMTGLASLNTSDIESIEVLKDAASAAIYGSRATNGVILITTKTGRIGAPKISVDMNASISNLPRLKKLEMADSNLLMEVLNEAVDNYNLQNGQNMSRFINPMPDMPAHDWLNDVLRTAFSRNLTASISGGKEDIKYYVSGTYKHAEGVAIDNELDQYSLITNVSGKAKPWLSYGANMQLSYTDNSRVSSGYSGWNFIKAAVEQYPWDEPYLPNKEWATSRNVLVNNNPLQAIKESDVWVKTYRALSSAFLEFHIIKGLNFKTTLSEDFQNLEDHVYLTKNHQGGYPTKDNPSGGILTDVRMNNLALNWDNTLTYTNAFECGLALDAMLGYSLQTYTESKAAQTGIGFPSPSFDVNSVASSYEGISTYIGQEAMQSVFGRVNLNYKNRYVMTLTLRTDGSSKFAPEHRWGVFPSASIGWNMDEEKWWRNNGTSLKIRASVGETGNQSGISKYAYQDVASGGFNYNGNSGLGLTLTGNRDLKWESALQENFGIDFSMLRGAFAVSLDLFNKDTYNLIYSKPVMITTGRSRMLCNIGSMNNKGLELSLAANAGKRDFRWHADFNIAFIKNKLTKLLDNSEIIHNSNFHALKVGEEVGTFYMVKMIGIYQTDDEVPEYLYQNEGVRAGDVKYEDINNDGKINADDRQFVGSANPIFSGGFNTTFSYKGWDLAAFFTYSYGNKVYEVWNGGLRLGDGIWPQLKSVCESRWTGQGTSNDTPRAIWGNSWNSTKFESTRFLHDASYLRMRTLTLSYNFTFKKAKIDNLRLYLQADNLFILTKWPYLDPEVSYNNNPATRGLDWLNPGQPRTFSFGLNIKF